MSCGYDLYCADCPGSSTSLDWNHAGEELTRVLKNRKAWEGVSIALDACQRLEADGALGQVVRFFGQHAGHRIIVKDEYGRIWERCGKEVRYTCGLPHYHYCVLPPDHSGECTIEEPTP